MTTTYTNPATDKAFIDWGINRIRQLAYDESVNGIIERTDLIGCVIRYKRISECCTDNKDHSAILANCIFRISEWVNNPEDKLNRINSEPGLVALFLKIGKR